MFALVAWEVPGPFGLEKEVSGGAGRGKGGGPGIPVQRPGINPGGGPGGGLGCPKDACLMTVSAGVSPVGVAGKVGNPSGPHLLNLVC